MRVGRFLGLTRAASLHIFLHCLPHAHPKPFRGQPLVGSKFSCVPSNGKIMELLEQQLDKMGFLGNNDHTFVKKSTLFPGIAFVHLPSFHDILFDLLDKRVHSYILFQFLHGN